MPHPDEGLIHAWLDGELGEREASRVAALVASDPAWAAAAAEARGLIAASARIVQALDQGSGIVSPAASPPVRRGRAGARWAWRAAAALVLMAGSALVLRRGAPELREPARVSPPASSPRASSPLQRSPRPPAPAGPALAATKVEGGAAVVANAPVREERGDDLHKEELSVAKQRDARSAEDAAAAPAASAPSTQSAALGASAARAQAAGKTTRLQPLCFERRLNRDSAARIIRLDAASLADSIRLERLTLTGDTLAAVNGSLTAVRVRCPMP